LLKRLRQPGHAPRMIIENAHDAGQQQAPRLRFRGSGFAGLFICTTAGTYNCGYNAGQLRAGTKSINQYFGSTLGPPKRQWLDGVLPLRRRANLHSGRNGQIRGRGGDLIRFFRRGGAACPRG
jgi:hypothetical protein